MNTDTNNLILLNSYISKAWDDAVTIRAQDLENGTDYSYTQIIEPWVTQTITEYSNNKSHILDIGCGCGYLTNKIHNKNRKNIIGIDLSPRSITYAKNRYPHIPFLHQDIYSSHFNQKFDICLAIMMLNNAPNLTLLLKKLANITSSTGKIILVIPHPSFWPQKHLDVKSFPYAKEASYQFVFSTKGRADYSTQMTYFHRPLEQYINSFYKLGYNVVLCKELLETSHDNSPDILGIVLEKY